MENWDISIGFVVYYPESHFIERVKQLALRGLTIWIFDNTPNGSDSLKSEVFNNQVHILGDGTNWGLGHALNALLKTILRNGFKQAIYFDQDTYFTFSTITWIYDWRRIHGQRLSGTEVIVNFAGNCEPLNVNNAITTNEVLLINSGSLYQLEILKEIGWHQSSIFLECVDYEICGRIRYHRLKTLKVIGCVDIDHEIYQPINEFKLGNWIIKYRLYPLNRTLNFVKGLLYWGGYYGFKGDFLFFLMCVRNVVTHLTNQVVVSFFYFVQTFKKKS
jgi:GT2 family glycosyltransferase